MREVTKIVTLRARPSGGEALGASLRMLVEKSCAEPGSAACVLHRSTDDPELFMVYERWHDAGAFDAHMATPHVASFLAAADVLLAEPASVEPFDVF